MHCSVYPQHCLVRLSTCSCSHLTWPPPRPPHSLRLPADRGAELLQQFAGLEFNKHAQRVRALWASELYR